MPSHTEFLPLPQVLSLDILSLDDQKDAHQVESRRVINAATGPPAEVSSLGTVQAKSLAFLGPGQLKRLNESITESHIRARGRVKFLDEAITKLDKYRLSQLSRKRSQRSRSEILATGPPNKSLLCDQLATGGISYKPASISSQNQVSSNSTDVGSHMAEDRNKRAVPDKRVCTSVADIQMGGRLKNANLPRPFGIPDHEREFLKPRSSSLSQAEDKVPPRKGCREKLRMKGKRSGVKTDISSTSTINGHKDWEYKLGVQHKGNNDSQARPSENHGIRSGPVHGVVSIQKLENSMKQNGPNVDIVTRNGPDGSSFASETMELLVGSEKDRTFLESTAKPTMHEENQAARSTAIIKGKTSQAPRSISATSAISSHCVVRTSPISDSWEQHSGTSGIHFAPGLGNIKHTAQTISSSSPVAQWIGQRPAKTARIARRTNLAPFAIQVDDRSFADGFGYNDTAGGKGAKPDSHAILGTDVAEHLSNCKSLVRGKVKTENLNSSTGLSKREHLEQDDERKSVDKAKKNRVVEVTLKQADPSLGTLVLPTNDSKVSSKVGSRDGIHRKGRSRRGLVSARIGVYKASDKIDITSKAKKLRSTRPVFDKVDNKSSQPLTKISSSDRKPLTRSRLTVNSGSSDLTGEMDDDHEEIVAAAEAAINTSNVVCSGSFWKEMEHYFAVPTKDDIVYLKQHVDFVWKTTQTGQAPTSSSQPTCFSNKKMDNDALGLFGRLKYTQDARPLYQKCIVRKWLDKLSPLLQMVHSAFIEDKNEQRRRTQDDSEQHDNFDYMSEVSPPGICNDIDSRSKCSSRIEPEMGAKVKINNDRVNRSYACSVSSNAYQIYLSGVLIQNDETGLDGDVEDSELDTLDERHTRCWQKNHDDLISGYQSDSTVSSIYTDAIEYKYKQMCLESLDNGILLELQNMGLFPEAVPDLALTKDDEILEELHKLQFELQQQESKNKAQIKNLEKAVLRKLQFEDRERERLAMNKLLERAFIRHIGCRGTNIYAKSSGSKVAKQAALAFAKRTVERCQNFDATGRSCFFEATLKKKLFFINSKETDIKSTGDTTECKTLPANSNSGGGPTPLVMKSLGAVLECPYADVSTLASENFGQLVPQQMQKKNMESKEPSDSCQAATSSLEQPGGKDGSGSIQTTKKEVLLEYVVGSSGQRNSSVRGSSNVGGRNCKCSEREREGKGKNKDTIARMNNAKSGLDCLGDVKGERKTKRKPQQRTAQLSREVTDLLNKPTEAENKCSSNFNDNARDKRIKAKGDFKMGTIPGISQDLQCEIEGAIDLSHLQLPSMEEFVRNGDLGDQGDDLGSLLNFEEDILQDTVVDYVGLDVPMDNLFDLKLSENEFT